METEIPVQRHDFPRVYKVDASIRRGINMLVLVVATISLFDIAVYLRLLLHHSGSLGNLTFIIVVGTVLVTGLGSGYNKRVILHRDAIEVAGWFYSRRLSFAEVRGWWASRFSSYVLAPNNGKRALVLPPWVHTDQIFRDWISTIPKIPSERLR